MAHQGELPVTTFMAEEAPAPAAAKGGVLAEATESVIQAAVETKGEDQAAAGAAGGAGSAADQSALVDNIATKGNNAYYYVRLLKKTRSRALAYLSSRSRSPFARSSAQHHQSKTPRIHQPPRKNIHPAAHCHAGPITPDIGIRCQETAKTDCS